MGLAGQKSPAGPSAKTAKTWEAGKQLPKQQNALNAKRSKNGTKLFTLHKNFYFFAGKHIKSIQFTYKNLQTVFKMKQTTFTFNTCQRWRLYAESKTKLISSQKLGRVKLGVNFNFN